MGEFTDTRILVVDDDPMFRLMLSQFLEKEGYQVVQAENGEVAVATFQESQPDCVLMDVMMPVLDGFEACKMIRSMPDGESVPVIMVTAKGSDEAVDQCYEAGASDYINKPIHWAVLRNRVRNLIVKSATDRRIRESEQRFSQIFSATKDAFWLIDAGHNELLYANDSFENIFCRSKDALRENPIAWMDCVHPDDRSLIEPLVDQYLRGDADSFEKEFRIIGTDGEIRWVMIHCFPVLDSSGKVIRRVGVASDITVRKMSQDYFQVLVKSVEAVPWSVDLKSEKFTYVGDQVTEVLGITADEMRDMDAWSALLHPDDRDQAVEYCRTQIAKGRAHEFEYRMVVDGESIWVRDTVAVNMGKDGPVSLSGFMFNITEVHERQERVRKLSQAIEQSGESVVITDREGTIEYVNPSFTKMTGYTAGEALGNNPRILKSGNQTEEFYERLWSTISSGEVWQSSLVDRRKDGSLYPAIMSIAPILDDDGKITHYVGVQQDMTAHEALEEKFRQAQKMEALGTLVGGIAHEFNNLLAGMTGNLYLARKKTADMPQVTKNLKSVEELGFRASSLIQQLLSFAHKGVVKMKPFGLTSFIKEISKLSRTSIPENISFNTRLCDEELVVKGDTTLLQQVLLNLLNNARDAVTGVAEAEISLIVETFEADESFISNHPDISARLFAHLIVKDNGTGINDEDIEHIFEPFYTTKEVGLGTGLGLSMAYGSIYSHGGVLEVESSSGKGASFHIYLPLITEKNMSLTSEGASEALSGHGELILLVDDNADVRNTGKDVLEMLGYRVVEASDGLQAVDMFVANQQEVSLIIMDIVMPRLGGIKAAERIKAISPEVKVIFATGYDKDATLKEEMPSDEATVLSKPYNIDVLSREIREQLDS